jgi:isopentenyl-diphosphate delta-isomerase
MSEDNNTKFSNQDPTAESRKKDHIDLAMKSAITSDTLDHRFFYEPLGSGHPTDQSVLNIKFLGRQMGAPIWVSSMTGGTQKAAMINENLARACGEFGLGMGLGSCRQLLEDNTYLKDFSVRKWMPEQPLYANLGIAQLEQLIDRDKLSLVKDLIHRLEADGLIIHVNPMQEWLQPEGDRFQYPPLETIKKVLDNADYKIIVKEVGQGMGPESLLELLKLPIEALDFAAAGGTNFAMLELLRSKEMYADTYECLAHVGHHALDMVHWINQCVMSDEHEILCRQVIISGGVKTFLDGYYLTQKSVLSSVYGQASAMLKHAQISYESVQQFIHMQIDGLLLAHAYLKIRE